jgi:hypothetical protein
MLVDITQSVNSPTPASYPALSTLKHSGQHLSEECNQTVPTQGKGNEYWTGVCR